MKKVLSVLAGLIVIVAAFAIVNNTTTRAASSDCTTGSKYTDFDGERTGNDTLTVWTKGNKKLCNDVQVSFSTFEVLNKNYNGQPFHNNPTAIPQQSIYNKTVTLKKGTNGKTTEKLQIPNECTPYQIDAYVGPAQEKITTLGGIDNGNAIVGKIFQKTKTDCTVKTVQVCNPANGQIITVPETDAGKYKPVGDEACKDLPVCEFSSKSVIKIKGYQFDASKYSKDVNDDKCKTPGQVVVCNPATGNTEKVAEDKVGDYKPVDDEACNPVTPPETPEELPQTGVMTSVLGLFGLGSVVTAGVAYIRSRGI